MVRILLTLILISGSTGYAEESAAELSQALRRCRPDGFEAAGTVLPANLPPRQPPSLEAAAEATLWNDLGYCHHQTGRLLEAERLYQRSLTLLESPRSAGDPVAMQVASNLTRLYLESGQISRAERLLGRFLPASTPLGKMGPERAVLLSDLAFMLMQRQEFEKAEMLFRDAIATLEREPQFQEQALIAMSNLSGLFAQTGRLPQALAYSRRARALLDTLPDCSPPTVVKTLANAAVLAFLDGNAPQAEALFREGIALAENRLPAADPLLGQVLGVYAQFLHQTERKRKARQVEKRAELILDAFRKGNLIGHTVEARSLMRPSATAGR